MIAGARVGYSEASYFDSESFVTIARASPLTQLPPQPDGREAGIGRKPLAQYDRNPAGTVGASGPVGRKGLRWVLDVGISKYYDTIQHHHLRVFLDRRVTDGVIRRMIDKWLKAGVLEHDLLQHTTEGTPQGGVVSPVLLC